MQVQEEVTDKVERFRMAPTFFFLHLNLLVYQVHHQCWVILFFLFVCVCLCGGGGGRGKSIKGGKSPVR